MIITKEIGNRKEEGSILKNFGVIYEQLGSVRKAIEYYEQALKIAKETGDRRGESADLGNLGNAYLRWESPEKQLNIRTDSYNSQRNRRQTRRRKCPWKSGDSIQ